MPNLPLFISRMQELYETDTQPFRKVRRLIDLAEVVIKYHTVVIVSNYLENREIHDDVKGILGSGLKTPSLGIWAFFTEKIHPHINEDEHFWKDFPEYFKKVLKPATDQIVPIRNHYAHGAVPTDEECEKDEKKLLPHVKKILEGGILGRDAFGTNSEGKVSIKSPAGRKLSLHPLLRFEKDFTDKEKQKSFTNVVLFYNDIRNGKAVGLLNYDEGIQLRDKEFMAEFLKTFPLPDWEKKATAQFRERIEELTENFKGRRQELADLKKNIREKDKGHLMVWGPPGVGKSTLLARAVQELTWENVGDEIPEEERLKGIHVQEYFIRRGSRTDQQGTYIEMMGRGLEAKFKTGIPVQAANPQDTIFNYYERFRAISSKLNDSGEKLVLFIDGLDEAEDELLRLIPTDTYNHIYCILASRDVPRTRKIYEEGLNPEYRKDTRLGGLNQNDIRALLNDYVNKYDIQDGYIAAIAERSEGNPLYLKLLCNTLENREVRLNDASQLPKEIGTFYETILKRFANLPNGEKVVDLLFLLTVARDFLSADVVSSILSVSRIQAEKLLEEASEVLYENPLTEDILDYQLFHESLRDFLWAKYSREVTRIETRVLAVCRNWKELSQTKSDPETLRYVLSYYISHLHAKGVREESRTAYPRKLSDSPLKSELTSLALNKEYFQTQLRQLQFYDVPISDSVLTLETAILDTAGDWGTAIDTETIVDSGNLETCLQLILHAGKTGHSAQTDIGIAFTWAKEGRVEDAVKRVLVIQEEKKLFDALCLIAWILADREGISEEEKKKDCEYVLAILDEKCPVGVVEWGEEDYLPRNAYWRLYKLTDDAVYICRRAHDGVKRVLSENLAKEKLFDSALTIAGEIEVEEYKVKANALGSIASGLASAGEMEQARLVFDRALEIAGEIEDEDDKASALGSIAVGLASVGEIEKAKLVFDRALETSGEIESAYYKAKALGSIAGGLASAGEMEGKTALFIRVLEIAGEIEIADDKAHALGSIGGGLASAGEMEQARLVLDRALEIAGEIKFAGRKAEVFELIALGLSSAGEIEKAKIVFDCALEIAGELEEVWRKAEALGSIASGLVTAVEIEMEVREALLGQALKIAGEIEYSDDKASVLGSIAVGLANASEFDRALEITGGIENAYYKADALKSIAVGLANAGEFARALEITGGIENAYYKADALKSIAGGLASASEMDQAKLVFGRALEIAGEIEDADDKARVLGSIAGGLASAGQREQAKLVFAQALEVTGKIDEYLDSTLERVALSLFLSGEFFRALQISDKIKDAGSKAEAMGLIAGGLASVGDIEQTKLVFARALEKAGEIEDARDKALALGSIAEGLVSAGDMEQGKLVFARALEIAGEIEDAYYKAKALVWIAGGLASAGEFGSAFEIAEEIEDSNWKARALGSVAGVLASSGEREQAKLVFARSLEIAGEIEGSMDKCWALENIARGLFRYGDIVEAKHVISQALDLENEIDKAYNKIDLLVSVAWGLFSVGEMQKARIQFVRALKIAGEIEDAYDKSKALKIIAGGLAVTAEMEGNKKLFVQTLEIVEKLSGDIEVENYKVDSINSLAIGLARANDIEGKQAMFGLALEISGEIVDPLWRCKAFVFLGRAISSMGDLEKAKLVFSQALTIAGEIEDAQLKNKALELIAGGLAIGGEMEFWNLWESQRGKITDWSYKQGSGWKNQYSKALFGIEEDSGKLNVKSKKLSKDEIYKTAYWLRACLLLPGQGKESYENVMRYIGWLAGQSRKDGVSLVEYSIRLGVGVGVLDREILGIGDGGSESEGFEAELAELDRLLEEEEITNKVYNRKVEELKEKWGR